jgi:hypothetical protein
LSFVAVSLAIVGFGVASRFLGKVLEDSVRAALSVFVLAVAALVADYFPRVIGSRFFRRGRNPLFLTRIAIFATWILALLGVAFIVKLISLRKVIDWGGITLAVAILVALIVEFGVKEQAQNLANKIIKRLKKSK